MLCDCLADKTQAYIPHHRHDPTAAQDQDRPWALPPSTAPGCQPQHAGKERHVHPPTLQREHLQSWTPGKGRGHTPQHNPQPHSYTEEAHKAIPAWRLAAHQADHESRHQEASAAREEPPRTRGKPWGTAPQRAPHADTPQTAEAVLALPLLAHHPNQK